MPPQNTYDAGDSADLEYLYVNASGALVNPSAIAAVAINPLGTQTALTPTRIATGTYEARLNLSLAGRWLSRWTATGVVNDSETISLMVRPDAPVRSDAAYATVDDVVRLAQGRTFNASSKPAIGDVQDWLALTAAELDGILRGQGYSTPIPPTATAAHALLAHYNAQGAACFVERAAPTASRQKDACQMWQSIKKALMAGEIELDAPRDASNSAPRSNAANQATPMFTTLPAFSGGYDW
jgi:hypothetical protein